jgi:patatin-like phospholipase/acyl hydrolase
MMRNSKQNSESKNHQLLLLKKKPLILKTLYLSELFQKITKSNQCLRVLLDDEKVDDVHLKDVEVDVVVNNYQSNKKSPEGFFYWIFASQLIV